MIPKQACLNDIENSKAAGDNYWFMHFLNEALEACSRQRQKGDVNGCVFFRGCPFLDNFKVGQKESFWA